MEAYYYRIYDKKKPSLTIEEGIIRHSEDCIYPGQYNKESYPDLPFECECHHFNSKYAGIEGFTFDIPVEIVRKYKQ